MWSYIAQREINITVKKVVQKMQRAGMSIPCFDIEFRPFFLYPTELSDDEPVDREVSAQLKHTDSSYTTLIDP